LAEFVSKLHPAIDCAMRSFSASGCLDPNAATYAGWLFWDCLCISNQGSCAQTAERYPGIDSHVRDVQEVWADRALWITMKA